MAKIPAGSTFDQIKAIYDAEAARVPSNQPVNLEPEPGAYTIDLRPWIEAGGDQYGCKGLPLYRAIINFEGPPGKFYWKFLGNPGFDQELIRFQATEQAAPPYCGIYGNGYHIEGPNRITDQSPYDEASWSCGALGMGNKGKVGSIDGGGKITGVTYAVAIRKDHELIAGFQFGGHFPIYHAHGFAGGKSQSGGDQRVQNVDADAARVGFVVAAYNNAVGGVTYEDIVASNIPAFFRKLDAPAGTAESEIKRDLGSGSTLDRIHMENLAALMIGSSDGKTICDKLTINSVMSNNSGGTRAGSALRLPEDRRGGFVDRIVARNWHINDTSSLMPGKEAVFNDCQLLDVDLGDLTPVIAWLNRSDVFYDGKSRALVTHAGPLVERAWGTYRGHTVRVVTCPVGTKKGDTVQSSLGPLGQALMDAPPTHAWNAKPSVPVFWEGSTAAALA